MTPTSQRFLERLRARVTALKQATAPWELHRSINDAEHLLLCDLLDAQEEEEVLKHEGAAELLRESQDVFCRYETLLEKSMARFMGAADTREVDSPDNLTQNYRQRYRTLAANEIALSRMSRSDQVLFIGSGPLPITAIEYVRQTGCSVTCVDRLADAIEISTAIVRHLGLAERFRFILSEGQHVPTDAYDVILVGVLAQPKAEILAQVERHAKAGCRILCRTTTGVRQFIYPRTAPLTLERFRPAGFSRAVRDQAISTQLLTSTGAARWEQEC